MREALVKMKDGRELRGPILAFNPPQGYMTIPSASLDLIYFRDIESAVQRQGRETADTVDENVDLLVRARKQGWDGT